MAHASRFLNCNEQKHSTNELELLAVVWSLEHFKYYLYGSNFKLQTDHKALLSALKIKRRNKTYQSRLTRWVDRLLPFHFTVQHVPGKNMGFADYFSRYPICLAPQPLESDKNYVLNLINTFKPILNNAQRISANQNAPNTKHAYNDVINTSKLNKHGFCQFRCPNQSHSCNYSNSSLHNFSLQISKSTSSSNSLSTKSKVLVCTRKNPNSNTFDKLIHKRPRTRKMINTPLQENTTVSNQPPQLNLPKSITTAIQTDHRCNIGKGLTPLIPTG